MSVWAANIFKFASMNIHFKNFIFSFCTISYISGRMNRTACKVYILHLKFLQSVDKDSPDLTNTIEITDYLMTYARDSYFLLYTKP